MAVDGPGEGKEIAAVHDDRVMRGQDERTKKKFGDREAA
jgi:hypothetical protein